MSWSSRGDPMARQFIGVDAMTGKKVFVPNSQKLKNLRVGLFQPVPAGPMNLADAPTAQYCMHMAVVGTSTLNTVLRQTTTLQQAGTSPNPTMATTYLNWLAARWVNSWSTMKVRLG